MSNIVSTGLLTHRSIWVVGYWSKALNEQTHQADGPFLHRMWRTSGGLLPATWLTPWNWDSDSRFILLLCDPNALAHPLPRSVRAAIWAESSPFSQLRYSGSHTDTNQKCNIVGLRAVICLAYCGASGGIYHPPMH